MCRDVAETQPDISQLANQCNKACWASTSEAKAVQSLAAEASRREPTLLEMEHRSSGLRPSLDRGRRRYSTCIARRVARLHQDGACPTAVELR
mmetsp:Transcript_17727/g.41231  ORF Transcript_17727/g.41231 Transcript_17727/m.41231 type:complete len:93 (-) Transcript_17727:2952-3230(-)